MKIFSHLSAEDTISENRPPSLITASTAGKNDKPRVNPFNEDQARLKRNASSVAYRDVVPVSQPPSTLNSHQPKMLDSFVETSPNSSSEDPRNRYDIPSIPYHPKLVRIIPNLSWHSLELE